MVLTCISMLITNVEKCEGAWKSRISVLWEMLVPASLALLRDWTFPWGLFLVVPSRCWPAHLPFPPTLCRAWTADYHSLLSAVLTLSHPKPSRKRGMHRISRNGEKGTESTSHFYHLPIARTWRCGLLGRDSRDTKGLHFAEHHQSRASQRTAPGWAQHRYCRIITE